MISVFFTYPLEILRVRMAYATRAPGSSLARPPSPTCASTFREIYKEGAVPPPSSSPTSVSAAMLTRFPLLKFYRGFTVTLTGMVPYAGMSFLTWGFLRARFLPHTSNMSRSRPTPIADLTIGAISGALAQTVAYPFEIVRRRMQVAGITRPDRWLRWGETVKSIWQTSGWRGFYVGLSIGYLKVVPMTAVSFAVWQGGKRMLGL
jgi:solute carrier family 25 protein 16